MQPSKHSLQPPIFYSKNVLIVKYIYILNKFTNSTFYNHTTINHHIFFTTIFIFFIATLDFKTLFFDNSIKTFLIIKNCQKMIFLDKEALFPDTYTLVKKPFSQTLNEVSRNLISTLQFVS